MSETKYVATVTFELPSGESIDAATAAGLLTERLYVEEPEFRIVALSVAEATR